MSRGGGEGTGTGTGTGGKIGRKQYLLSHLLFAGLPSIHTLTYSYDLITITMILERQHHCLDSAFAKVSEHVH